MKTDEQLLEEAENALKNVFAAIDHGWWSIDHDAGCPEDDTCECNGGVNGTAKIASDALTALSYRVRFSADRRVVPRGLTDLVAHRVKERDGDHVVLACGARYHHEHLFADLTCKVHGCFECFPLEQPDYLPPGTHLAIHGPIHRDGTRTTNIGCMDTGKNGWTLRAARKVADEGDPGAVVEVIDRKTCPTHGVGGEEEDLNAD